MPTGEERLTEALPAASSVCSARGGRLVFGPPISEPRREQNGDGTRHAYLVQYSQNSRLEYRPELRTARYEISVGQMGLQALQQCGWLQ